MVKLTILDVPEEAVEAVKKMAAAAIDRHYRATPSQTKVDAHHTAVDSFRTANGLDKKYNK